MSKKHLHHDRHNDPFCGLAHTVSASECTGLMPAQIHTEEQGEALASLQDIFPIPPQKKK